MSELADVCNPQRSIPRTSISLLTHLVMTAEIDEGLYSRQLYVLGKEAMQKMANSNVLIVGLGGIGVEIAKNVALAGVKSLSLWDPTPTALGDLATQFYLNKDDVGKSRAQACVARLAELNQYVPVSLADGGDPAVLAQSYECVVASDISAEQAVELNDATRKAGKSFIWVESRGLAGFVFTDFGSKFTVVDTNGEEPKSGDIAELDEQGEVFQPGSGMHGLETGDVVEISKVEPAELNGEYKVKVNGPLSFNIGELKAKYVKGGEWKQVKQPQTIEFQPLVKQLANPEYFLTDFAKFDRPPQLHIAFLAVNAFRLKNNRLPSPYVAEDANQVLELAKHVSNQFPDVLGETEIDEKLLRKFAFQSGGEVAPIVAFLGGTAAQEALKAVSGKFMPIRQFMYYDAFEALPETVTAEDSKPLNSRYDRLYAVFGKHFIDQLHNLRVFLVGAGAIGCEVLKNYALLGVGTGPNGHVTVTDNDTIERSNLNRQFLFRAKDVGRPKSETAATAVAAMNPDFEGHFTTLTDKIDEASESKFNEAFWSKIDIVTNALDNVEARRYVDQRCIFFEKPLIESGTLGTKGNTQVIIPFMTESYSSSYDPPEKGIPVCTLRNFPSKIDHTIAWAKNLFEELFANSCQNVNQYLTQPNYVESTLKQSSNQKAVLETVYSYLVKDRPRTFEECVEWAEREFEALYRNEIEQLLYNFPPDAKTSSGEPFWAPPKKTPHPLKLSPSDINHFEFIVAAANLRAFNFGLRGESDPEVFKKILAGYKPTEWKPDSKVKIATTDEEAAQQDQNSFDTDQDELLKLAEKLPPPSSLAGFRLNPVEFEKDDDTNYHIAFINAASNLRAENYGIEPVDKSKTKFIAGRIIPAIATTTALVTGLATIEMLKVIQKKPLEDYKNGFVNIALPFFGFSEPIASPKLKYGKDKEIDQIWGRFTIDHDCTLKELIDYFQEKHGLEITMISSANKLLMASFYPKVVKERLPLKISQLIETVAKQPLPPSQTTATLEVCADDEEGEEIDDLPFVVVKLK